MRLTITENKSKHELSFGSVTQLCGRNIPLKIFIIDSLCKHFSSEKYKEYEEKYIDNVEIEGEVPGRKQWECFRVDSIESIISAIQLNKGSILGKCIKEYISEFECQKELSEIDSILLQLFDRLNKNVFANESIEIQYKQEDLFTMIQQTTIRTADGNDLHELGAHKLINVFIDIIGKQQQLIPEKRLYIFENLDHLIDKNTYVDFVKNAKKCQDYQMFGSYFLLPWMGMLILIRI